MPLQKSYLCGTMALPSPWPYYLLPHICVPFLPSVDPPLRHYGTPLSPISILTDAIAFSCLRTYPFHAKEKVLMLHGVEFLSRLGMATNTPSSVYKPLHEYRILRVSNSPHLYKLCTTLSVIAQHLPLCTVLSFTKRPRLS
ncbi:hypothetical protein GW17_00025399 [Ensete ventricosum]|nr:hypothetical protein GW17_00025399 [Ensete ventricosum]